MQCHKCRNEAVFFQPYSGRHLCSRHLDLDIETRAKRSIRSHRWMQPGDHIAVVLFGDKKSAALALFLKKLIDGRRDIRLSAIPGSGDRMTGCDLPAVRRIAERLSLPLAEIPAPGGQETAAYDRPAKIALPFTLDDIAADVLIRFLFDDVEKLVCPPRAGGDGIPVICPFIAVPSEELDLYWDSQETGAGAATCPPLQDPLLQEVTTLFKDYNCRHPATGFALLNLAEELSSGDVAGIAAGRGGTGLLKLPGEVHGHGS